MKRPLLTTLLLICLINVGFGQSAPGVYPSVIDNGCVNSAYIDSVDIVFLADTTVSVPPFGTFTIPPDSVLTIAFLNVPAGLSAACVSPNCTVYPPAPGQSPMETIVFSGTPTAPVTNNVIQIVHTYYITAPVVGVQSGQDTSEVQITIGSGAAPGTDTQTACNSFTWIDGNTYTTSNNTATYAIAGGAASGCDSTVTLDLTINMVNAGASLSGQTLTADATGATYQWLDCDNGMSAISGETNQSFTPSATGNYAVIVTENGCTDTSGCMSVTVLGLPENSFGDQLTVYPNPTAGNVHVDLGAVYQSAEVTITDLSGRVIYSDKYKHAQKIEMKLKEPAGTYLMTITADDKKAVLYLVRE